MICPHAVLEGLTAGDLARNRRAGIDDLEPLTVSEDVVPVEPCVAVGTGARCERRAAVGCRRNGYGGAGLVRVWARIKRCPNKKGNLARHLLPGVAFGRS